MKRYVIISVVILAVHSVVYSQSNKIDSLLILLKADKPDTNKLFNLNRLSKEYKDIGSYDSAAYYANGALKLSKSILKENPDTKTKHTTQKNVCASYNTIGNIFNHQGNYPEAIKNHLTCLEISQSINDKKGIASAYNNLGNVSSVQGNNAEALRYYFASLKIMEELDDKKSIANTSNNIGRVYYLQGNHAEALKLFMASLEMYKKLGIKKGIAFCYNNIGLIYYAQGKYDESLKNNFASLKIREGLGDKLGLATSYSSLGIVYFDQAEMETDEAMRSAKFKQGLKSYLSSLEMYEALGDKAGVAATNSSIGNVYIKTGKYDEAEKYLQRAMDLSKRIGYKECIRDTYNGFAKVQSAKGDFKGAFKNHKLYIVYRDSIDNEDTRKKTVQSQMTYDFEKKEAIAVAEHKKELENQQALSDEKSRKQKIVLVGAG